MGERVVRLFENVRRPKFLTLTVRNVPTAELSRATYKRLTVAFAKFRKLLRSHAPWWISGSKARQPLELRGGVYAIETTFHHRGEARRDKTGEVIGTYTVDQAHPHLHALIDADYLPQELLARLWATATNGWGAIADIREVKGKNGIRSAVAELAKYATKMLDLAGEELVTFRGLMHGRKLLAPFGSMFGRKVEEEQDHEDEHEGEPTNEPCPCGLDGPWEAGLPRRMSISEAVEAAARLELGCRGRGNRVRAGP